MANWYLNADSGDDGAGDGSSGNPWETIAKAHTEASGGDTVYLQASSAAYAFATQTFTKALTWEGVSGDPADVVIDAGGNGRQWWFQADTVWSNVTLYDAGLSDRDGLLTHSSGVTTVFNNVIFDTIDLSLAENYWYGGLVNVQVSASNVSVTLNYCAIKNCSGAGAAAHMFGASLTTTNISIALNNCTIIYTDAVNRLAGVTTGASVSSIEFHNCIVADLSGAAAMNFEDPSSAAAIVVRADYSCMYSWTGAPTGTGVITSDPLLVGVAAGQFGLRPTSPCINTADLP